MESESIDSNPVAYVGHNTDSLNDISIRNSVLRKTQNFHTQGHNLTLNLYLSISLLTAEIR